MHLPVAPMCFMSSLVSRLLPSAEPLAAQLSGGSEIGAYIEAHARSKHAEHSDAALLLVRSVLALGRLAAHAPVPAALSSLERISLEPLTARGTAARTAEGVLLCVAAMAALHGCVRARAAATESALCTAAVAATVARPSVPAIDRYVLLSVCICCVVLCVFVLCSITMWNVSFWLHLAKKCWGFSTGWTTITGMFHDLKWKTLEYLAVRSHPLQHLSHYSSALFCVVLFSRFVSDA